ncbi:LrgA family protein [Azoarcus sp. CIB]|uniref:CidA/LrgA family protein n=1 Tax=Aromatoleum sp. (strain CIB) TaxID=198107 RepID=UPI00067D9E7A|nr:CidA/LrgA family protein [Azoarcus sp. CIB]AKU13160.1 LrgA family protein [Azoarcus sp. CIB]
MIGALTLLLVFQLIGEALARGLDLPIPGPVIGMGLMFATLVLRKGPSAELRGTATGILQHLSLLFIPAGTGVMLHFQRLADEWLPLTVALIASTLLSIAISALLLHALSRHTPHGEEQQ